MAFCKVCDCGSKIIFERRLSFPDKCPTCGRLLVDYVTYDEADPLVSKIVQGLKGNSNEDDDENDRSLESISKGYYLKLDNGKVIAIPNEGCIVGRTQVGAAELSEFPSVSREHIHVMPRRHIGVIIEDISSYGTLVNGIRIEKNTPVKVTCGEKITLCNVEATLCYEDGDN